MVYIIGHKSPDLDSVAAAIAYAEFKNKFENTEIYKPALSGEANKETEFVLDKFNFSKPEILESLKGVKVILVDHNENSQILEGSEEAEIIEVLDHHKINFSYSEPIKFYTEAWGASSTIIADLFFKNNIEISQNMAGLLLSAILIDTVIAKSPTTTDKDKEAIIELARIAQIDNWQNYGLELFKVRSSVKELSPSEIITSDFKDFEFKAGKFGIGQVETADLKDFTDRENELQEELKKIKEEGGYHTTMLLVTDIINQDSIAMVNTDDRTKFGAAFDADVNNGKCLLKGVVSRKKQIIPVLSESFDK